MKLKRIVLVLVLLAFLAVLFTGCIPGDARYTVESPAGFWWGLWHGLVVWISFIIGLFTGNEYTIYEAVNTGWTYNLGFLIGASCHISGISGGLIRININSKKRKAKRGYVFAHEFIVGKKVKDTVGDIVEEVNDTVGDIVDDIAGDTDEREEN